MLLDFLILKLPYISNLINVLSQAWPEELPLIINGTLETGDDGSVQYGWQLDLPVVMFSFSFCVICILILVQVCTMHADIKVFNCVWCT